MKNLNDSIVERGLIAHASVNIEAPIYKVWNALIDPEMIRQYMFGAEVISTWKAGSPIVWKGFWKEKAYEDKGTILRIEPRQTLQYSHFSPLAGFPDIPENYHIVTYKLYLEGNEIRITLSQDNNETEQVQDQAKEMWQTVLGELKRILEK